MVNRLCKFAMLMLCVNSMCGCTNVIDENLKYIPDKEDNSSYSEYVLPMDYDFNNAIEDGYVLYNNDGTIENEDRIKEFCNNSKNNVEDIIYIVRFTPEGDEVVSTYVYVDGEYKLYIDSRRDGYSNDEVEIKILKRIDLSTDAYGRTMIVQSY